jgi:hypothetical protein
LIYHGIELVCGGSLGLMVKLILHMSDYYFLNISYDFIQCVRVDSSATTETGETVNTFPCVKRDIFTPRKDQSFITVMPEVVEEAEPPPKYVYFYS